MHWGELAKHLCSIPRTLAIFPQTPGKRKPPFALAKGGLSRIES